MENRHLERTLNDAKDAFDTAIGHIEDLENEIERLTSKYEDVASDLESANDRIYELEEMLPKQS